MLLYMRRIVKDARRPLGAFYGSPAEIYFQNSRQHSWIIRRLGTFQIRRNRLCRQRLVSSRHLLYSWTPFRLIEFIGTIWGRRGSKNGENHVLLPHPHPTWLVEGFLFVLEASWHQAWEAQWDVILGHIQVFRMESPLTRYASFTRPGFRPTGGFYYRRTK